jgi:hypothetical protein
MISLLTLAELIILLVTHPLEPITMRNYDFSKISVAVVNQYDYTAPSNGYVKEIIEVENNYQVILELEDKTEIVYSGLTEVNKTEGEFVQQNEIIGKDETISDATRYVIMFYEENNHFPQFKGKELNFSVAKGTKAYMIADSVSVIANSIPSNEGQFIRYAMTQKPVFIDYLHLQSILTHQGLFVRQGTEIVFSGNTGAIREPCLTLRFDGTILGGDIRVVYMKAASIVSTN